MLNKIKKSLLVTVIGGSMLQFGGCGDGWFNWNQLWRNAVSYGVLEFALDNDTVFDLFEGGATN